MKYFSLFVSVVFLLFMFSCSNPDIGTDQKSDDNELNKELAGIMEIYGQAVNSQGNDLELVGKFEKTLKNFDGKYGTSVYNDFAEYKNTNSKVYSSTGTSSYPALTNLPINKDGAVYLSGGNDGAVSIIISYVSPKATPGKFYHGAVLDINKFDPTNLEGLCFQTAILKGAGFEKPIEWMKKPNVAVLNPNVTLDTVKLNNAQTALDYYCNPNNTNMKYGFFKDYVNIFSLVEKSDNYYWYCTKVVWRVYNLMGFDIDSNTSKVDWTTSGIYSLAKSYYNVRYFYSSSTAQAKLNEYINNAKKTIVLAEEIYFSPYLTKIYEVVRSN
ncbi:MAG: hypothetical protein A2086_09425 [Spirochaetes bacterium GWD1_27_9]|nr:MAG: hypothetical protein A2Z98_06275 [Spirochaetes bacterium GWB1_27_13]OHD21811.1 MAG: hypothetical protein A2Y34_01810 [Spirochaetes bacterium GWC1_27_15]OHD29801.1 MAG: hypothetical protein A2086_09425 [Spirochaetes bacterium GWD1_27_9]